jgi:hypothetical protein
MCGEGWGGDVERLIIGAAEVLREDGPYVLVSYKLAGHMRGFLLSEQNRLKLIGNSTIYCLARTRLAFHLGPR